MKNLFKVFAACLVSVVSYLVMFTVVLHKPLSFGFMLQLLEKKLAYAGGISVNKMVIVAGSNGLYSHRCETFEHEMRIPCVNASFPAGFGIDYRLAVAKELVRSGDVVLMPLEVGTYCSDMKMIENSAANPLIIRHDRTLLWRFEVRRIVRALFYFDLKFLFSALTEMTVAALRGTNLWYAEATTVQGDVKDHSPDRGAAFRRSIDSAAVAGADEMRVQVDSAGYRLVEDFLRWAKDNRITVVGTLPTMFDDRPHSDELVEEIADLYRRTGHRFLVLPNRSQYGRDCFFDSIYHLNEQCQIEHSGRLAHALGALLRKERWFANP